MQNQFKLVKVIPNYPNYAVKINLKHDTISIYNLRKREKIYDCWVYVVRKSRFNFNMKRVLLVDATNKRKWLSINQILNITFTEDEINKKVKEYTDFKMRKMFDTMKLKVEIGKYLIISVEELEEEEDRTIATIKNNDELVDFIEKNKNTLDITVTKFESFTPDEYHEYLKEESYFKKW